MIKINFIYYLNHIIKHESTFVSIDIFGKYLIQKNIKKKKIIINFAIKIIRKHLNIYHSLKKIN